MSAETPEVELFLAIRPYYNPQHVRDIQAFAEHQDTPFHRACADWHKPDETCSELF